MVSGIGEKRVIPSAPDVWQREERENHYSSHDNGRASQLHEMNEWRLIWGLHIKRPRSHLMGKPDLTGDSAAMYKDLRSNLTAEVGDESFSNVTKELNQRGKADAVRRRKSGHSL